MSAPYVIPTIFTAVDRITPVAQRIEASLMAVTTGAGTATAALAASIKNIGTQMHSVAMNAAILGAAIVLPLGMATREAIDFEKQMSNVATLMDRSKESVKAMSDGVLDLTTKAPVGLEEVGKSMYLIRAEGFKGAQGMEILNESARLATAGLATTEEAASSLGSAIRVFEKEGKTAHEFANGFFTTVATGRTTMAAINEGFGQTAALVEASGVKFSEFMAMTAAMTNTGMTASEAMTAIRGASQALIKPSGEMIKIYRQLGVTTGKELIHNMGGLVPAMDAIGEAAKRSNLNVAKAFGRVQGFNAYTHLTGALRGQFDLDIQKQTDGIDRVGQAYALQTETTAAKLQMAKNNLEMFAVRTGELLLPVLGAMADGFGTVAGAMGRFAENHEIIAGAVTGSLAVFGGFTVAIAGAAATVYVLTKAIWLWQLAYKAILFTQAAVAVMTGRLTGAMLVNSAASKGAAFAIQFLNREMIVATLTSRAFWVSLGLIGVALAVIGSVMSDDYTVERYNAMLGETADKFAEIKPAATEAQLAMEAYNKAVEGFNADRDYAQHRVYEYNRGVFHGLSFDVTHPIKTLEHAGPFGKYKMMDELSGASAPRPEDFPGMDMEAFNQQQRETEAGKQDVAVNLYMTNEGGNVRLKGASASNGATVAPSVTNTYSPQIQRND